MIMQRKLLTTGTTSKNKKGRWDGSVWYLDEFGERKRKAFSGKTQREVLDKIKKYIEDFNDDVRAASSESNKPLSDSMQNWLEVFKYLAVQRTTYDRYDMTAKHQIYPSLGDKPVGDITSADIMKVLNEAMMKGMSYSSTKKIYNLLSQYFDYLEKGGMSLLLDIFFVKTSARLFWTNFGSSESIRFSKVFFRSNSPL